MLTPENLAGQLTAWENGKLSSKQEQTLFQQLVDCGLMWKLQERYCIRATHLLESGAIHCPKQKPSAPGDQAHDWE
jgi:hypothetical protein